MQIEEKNGTWLPITEMPEDNLYYRTKIADGKGDRNFAMLRKSGGLFFTPSDIYVYYTPTHFYKP